MTSISDILNTYFESADPSGGMSTLHLLSLPGPINRVLRLFLRNKEMPYEGLRNALDDMPADSRLNYAELDEMLELLCKREWLIRSEQDGRAIYAVNLRPAVASATTKASTASGAENHSVEELWKATQDSERGSGEMSQEAAAPDKKAEAKLESLESDKDKDTGKVSADDLWDALG